MKHRRILTQGEMDPFHTYLHVNELVGSGHAFLLEAGREADHIEYQTSIIGVCPIVEVQIQSGLVSLTAVKSLASHFRERLHTIDPPAGGSMWSSVIDGETYYFLPPDPMAFLEEVRRTLRDLCAVDMTQPFSAGFLGYAGYDAVHYLEKLPTTTLDDRAIPDVRLQWHAGVIQMVDGHVDVYRQDDAVALASHHMVQSLDAVERTLDHLAQNGMVVPPVLAAVEKDIEEATVHYDVTEERYCANVEQAKAYIRAGDIFQVVLSTRIRIEHAIHPYEAYNQLRRINPSPYMFVAEYAGMRLYGASPEVQFRCVGGQAEMKPIAGTSRGRGLSREEDAALVAALKADQKESAEHVMLVDLCRNDLGRIAKIGSVQVPDFMVVERYSHLYHLVSSVEATLRDDVSVFHALWTTFPNGTLSGAPKIRAMEIIDELETIRRGPYGGFIGMIDADANANTAIIIRTVVEVGDTQYVQVGAGIVLDSDPASEWQECHHKAGAILDVLTGLHSGKHVC